MKVSILTYLRQADLEINIKHTPENRTLAENLVTVLKESGLNPVWSQSPVWSENSVITIMVRVQSNLEEKIVKNEVAKQNFQ